MTKNGWVLTITFFLALKPNHALENFFDGLQPKEVKLFSEFLKTPLETEKFKSNRQIRKGNIVYHLKVPDEMDYRPPVGYTQKKSIKVHHAARTMSKIIFKVHYHFDENGRRKVLPSRPYAPLHFILGGDSFALGTGIQDKDTLLYLLLKDRKHFSPKNISVTGSGPNTMLSIVTNELKYEVGQKSGIFLFLYNDYHIERSNAFAMERQWLKDSPFYSENKKGVLIDQGPFKKAQPLRTYFYNIFVKTTQLFGLNLNFPRRTKTHISYTCKLISQTRNQYLQNYPYGRFILYAHPFSPMGNTMKKCLLERGIEVLKAQFKWSPQKHEIPFEGHPNATATKLVAKDLETQLLFN